MQPIDASQLQAVCGGETFRRLLRNAHRTPDVPVGQTYQQTLQFFADNPAFYSGVFDLPIGHGKHVRNLAFVGPYRKVKGRIHHDRDEYLRGVEITRATHDAR